MPETMTMMIAIYKAYATMLDLILGVTHCVAIHFQGSFIPALERQLSVIKAVFQASLPAILPLFLCHTQVQFTMYFNVMPCSRVALLQCPMSMGYWQSLVAGNPRKVHHATITSPTDKSDTGLRAKRGT